MTSKFGPYTFPGVIDCGYLMDLLERDVAKAKSTSYEAAVWMLDQIKQGHADWLLSHELSGRALRRAGSPFSEAYDDLEKWVEERKPPKAKKAKPQKQLKDGFVYVIGAEGDDHVVKIGFAANVDDRRSTLQTSSHRTLRVLALTRGTLAAEKQLHRRFKADHIRGEWFNASQQIKDFIAEHPVNKKQTI